MSSILYYSKYCETSKKYLQLLSKSNVQKDIHFICIDKRVKEANNKTYIILDNGQKIVLPENVTKVPALLLLNQGYAVPRDFLTQPVKLFLELNRRFQNICPERLEWPVEALIEV